MKGDRNKGALLAPALLGLYLLFFGILAVSPYDRAVWWAENLPIMGIVLGLTLLYPFFRFSPLSYGLMAVLIFLHTIGGHYTFERVPFQFVTDLFGFQRNHYDRMAHFSVGFYAYPMAEILVRRGMTRSRVILFTYPLLFIISVAALYEMVEWIFAVSADPGAGTAFLGSQGDIWDAQKDMLADTLGALLALVLFGVLHREPFSQRAEESFRV